MDQIVQMINSYSENGGPTSNMGDQVREAIMSGKGKWVRYDENGKMIKGWVTITGTLAEIYPNQEGNTYYYDYMTGLMAKGWTTIGGQQYYFDEVTGVLQQ
jgi:glucan-binding YG repeat protein